MTLPLVVVKPPPGWTPICRTPVTFVLTHQTLQALSNWLMVVPAAVMFTFSRVLFNSSSVLASTAKSLFPVGE